ncbi:trimethylamine methyltransferase family protein [Aestuariivirga litoralis]|uniref:trimethylamine methyltransferase family protein n=1 Tax=Aestuariivirga litoralis TaxID=2650924 RepID=UPI0018C7029A|nr:trimethylamine methyltransferase family protein [Aestuariivirga litoralis]MBG1231921.1 trimethylamine methyltransferase family protein [Aestuariivirga litoralis]
MSTLETEPRRRRGGARANPGAGGGSGLQQLPERKVQRRFAPTEIISADELESIHRASLKVLSEIGMDFNHPEAHALLKAAGAQIDGERVRFDPAMIEELVAHAPETFMLHARNPAHSRVIGGNNIMYGTVGSPPNAHDMEGGRRTGNRADYQNFLRLGQYFNTINFSAGYPVEPVDIHASIRHLDALYDMATIMDKPLTAYVLGEERTQDALMIAKLMRGIDDEQFHREPSVMTIVNTNSPLKLDFNMLNGMLRFCRAGQIVCVTPFTLAGAMAPVTMAGALVLQNAEALAGIAFCQLVKKGAPVIYGGFTSNVDMKSGAPAFGTPEYMKAQIVGGQLARRYKVPYRTSNTNAANTVDAQAAYESVFSLWGLTQGGGNFIMHGAGWLEGGLVASFEKFVLDVDLIQMVTEFLQPLEINEDALGFEAIKDVGPGGHFFGTQHTLNRYTNAFYSPLISDWRNNQQWVAAGSPDAYKKANQVYKQALNEYVKPPMDEGVHEALKDFVERRKREGGAPTDF